MAKAHTWLFPLGSDYQIALSDHEMVEYVVDAEIIDAPFMPIFCKGMMLWRERLIPVLDINRVISRSAIDSSHHLCVVAYQDSPRTALHYVAIALDGMPVRLSVDDDQACMAPPEFVDHLSPLVLSAINITGRRIPILDISYLCSTDLRDALNQSVVFKAISLPGEMQSHGS